MWQDKPWRPPPPPLAAALELGDGVVEGEPNADEVKVEVAVAADESGVGWVEVRVVVTTPFPPVVTVVTTFVGGGDDDGIFDVVGGILVVLSSVVEVGSVVVGGAEDELETGGVVVKFPAGVAISYRRCNQVS
jgi:hypothetical protein